MTNQTRARDRLALWPTLVSDLHLIGTINNEALSFTSGQDGSVGLISPYPKDSAVATALTGQLGYRRAIPLGAVYIAHCEFSRVSR